MKLAQRTPSIIGIIVLLALSAVVSACGVVGGSSQQQGGSQLVDTGQSESTAPGTGTAVPTKQSSREASATAEPAGVAGVKISGQEAGAGNLTITISVQPARRMVAEGSATAGATPQPRQGQSSQGQTGPAQQEQVLGDQMLHVTKNLDAAQAPPPDPKEAQGDFIRHVDVQVKDKATGQVVPYLNVTMDVLRDGRPVRYDVALVPEVPAGGKADQLHYGNNVAFPGKGRYQLFVRMPASSMLGDKAPPYAQFDVSIQ